MVLAKYKSLFHELEMPKVDEITFFSLIPPLLEKQIHSLDKQLGLFQDSTTRKLDKPIPSHSLLESKIYLLTKRFDLSSPEDPQILSPEEIIHYNARVPGYSLKSKKELNLSGRSAQIKEPCAMLVDNIPQLMQEVGYIYQIAYAHYITAMNEMYGFPLCRCDESSINIFSSALMLGYPNVACVVDNPNSHVFNVFPFILKDPNIEGVVVVDPTSDQLGDDNSPNKEPRNQIFITEGVHWDNKKYWSSGNNLYPTHVFHIGSPDPFDINMGVKNMIPTEEYFDLAFQNPIRLDTLD